MSIVLIPQTVDVSALDFTSNSSFIDSIGLIEWRGEGGTNRTQASQLRPVRSDVGNNPHEIRPESGDVFSQGDFRGGMGQLFFHGRGARDDRFFWGDGVFLDRDGSLKLATKALVDASGDIGAIAASGSLEIANGSLFLAFDTTFKVTTNLGSTGGTFTSDNPHAGEGTVNIQDATSEGTRLYAALGVNGVHVRDAAGTWTHLQPDAATDLDISTATKVLWAKDRLFAVGGTSSRSFYEIGTDSTPDPLRTLPAGWAFQKPFESASYIYVPAVSTLANKSRIYRFGLDSTGLVLEEKGYTEMPEGVRIYVGIDHLGSIYLAGGRSTTGGGANAIFYQAFSSEAGELTWALIEYASDSGSADLSVRAMSSVGEKIYLGWSTAADSFGGGRDGIACYDPAYASFVLDSYRPEGASGRRVLDVISFKNHIVWTTTLDMYFDNPEDSGAGGNSGTYNDGTFISSLADWGNAATKTWRSIEITGNPIAADESVDVYYTLSHPEEDDWTLAGSWDTLGSKGERFALTDVEGRVLAIKLEINASSSAATVYPTVLTVTAIADPRPTVSEWDLVRTYRVFDKDRLAPNSKLKTQSPRDVLSSLEAKLHDWVTFYEPHATYTARVESVGFYEIDQEVAQVTSGEDTKEAFIVQVAMRGTKN